MKIRSKKGLAGVDMVIAIMAVMLFSTILISLIYYNTVENVKVTKETLAMIYITEIFENIGIEEDFEKITEENIIEDLVPNKVKDSYDVEITVSDDFEEVPENQENKIIKKITAKLTYEVGNKLYSCSMERLKVKE